MVWLVCNFPVSEKLNLEYGAKIEAVKQDKKTAPEAKALAAAALENELAARQMEYSFAGRTGKLIEPFIRPLGFDWRLGVALTAGLAAKEVVVATMGTIYALGEAGENESLTARLRGDPAYNPAIAIALIVFVLLYVPAFPPPPCSTRSAGN